MKATSFALVALPLVGCVEAAPDIGITSQDVVLDNTASLNGISLNGISLNGISLNGISLNGISLNGISLNGISLNGISLNGISLNGTVLNGSRWTGQLTDGSALGVRIDSVGTLSGANHDVGTYVVSYETTAGWKPLCGVDQQGNPIHALAVPGVWNQQAGVPGGGAYSESTTQFTWACREKSIAKCVELGYKPWNGYAEQLATCVRTLRGDFCGDGTPYTVDGTRLNLYDDVDVQDDTRNWIVEGEWTPAGSRCITRPRYTRFRQAAHAIPHCSLAKLKDDCGSFDRGAVIVSELPRRDGE